MSANPSGINALRHADLEESYSIGLNEARLCAETTCDRIYNSRARVCPSCGSSESVMLATALGTRRPRVFAVPAGAELN